MLAVERKVIRKVSLSGTVKKAILYLSKHTQLNIKPYHQDYINPKDTLSTPLSVRLSDT